jgi:hypothetical protein
MTLELEIDHELIQMQTDSFVSAAHILRGRAIRATARPQLARCSCVLQRRSGQVGGARFDAQESRKRQCRFLKAWGAGAAGRRGSSSWLAPPPGHSNPKLRKDTAACTNEQDDDEFASPPFTRFEEILPLFF